MWAVQGLTIQIRAILISIIVVCFVVIMQALMGIRLISFRLLQTLAETMLWCGFTVLELIPKTVILLLIFNSECFCTVNHASLWHQKSEGTGNKEDYLK